MAIVTHAKFHFNRLMITFTFGIRACDPKARRTTEKAGRDTIKPSTSVRMGMRGGYALNSNHSNSS